jgi:hypothetical protein
MPELSRFYGMVIQMYFADTGKHHKPHIHVLCGDEDVVIALDGEVLAGSLPKKKLRAVLVWMDFHEDELYQAWNKAVREEHFGKIKALE